MHYLLRTPWDNANVHNPKIHPVVGLVTASLVRELTDAQLLRRFAEQRDEEAFAVLLRRHGPLVLSACRRLLSNWQDVEDAFQATFLALAQKSGSMTWSDSVASWLYLVALRAANRARKSAARRLTRERAVSRSERAAPEPPNDVAEVLHEELSRLPERYRAALVLCCLEGKSGEEAARQLGRPVGTVWYQLARGRELLRGRLVARGIRLTLAGLGVALANEAAAVALLPPLAAATSKAVALLASGTTLAGAGISPAVQSLLLGLTPRLVRQTTLATVLALIVLVGGLAGFLARGDTPTTTSASPMADGDAKAAGTRKVVGYFTEWSVYDRNYHIKDVPAAQLTHLNYAFARITDAGDCAFADKFAALEKAGDDPDAVRGNVRQLQGLKKKHVHLKILLSVGGWTLSSAFSDAALTAKARTRLARSCVEMMAQYDFDGLDLDWEYPVGGGQSTNKTRPEDKENYTLLLAELRKQLDAQASTDHKRYLLTVAGPAGPATLPNLEIAKIAPLVDWFNVTTYDFHGGNSPQTNFTNALYQASADPARPDDPQRKYNVAAGVQAYVEAGVPREKIVVGLALYGRGWGGVRDMNNGLYQEHATELPRGTWEAGVWDYKDLAANYVGKFKRHWSAEAKVPWLYDPVKGVMISYEDPESIRLKAQFVAREKLGGVMLWELSGDDTKSSLLQAVRAGLQRPPDPDR